MAKAKIINIGNHKGGVGKTITSLNLSAGITRIPKAVGKYRVLVIDMDPQSNLTSTLFPFKEKEYKQSMTMVDVFNREPLDNCIVKTSTKGLDLCPSHIDLFQIEMQIASSVKVTNGLKSAIDNSTVRDVYDVIIIDSPPNLGPFMMNSFVASDYYIVPLESESLYALEGLDALNDRILEIKEISNKNLKLLGYLITMHDGRNSTCKSTTRTIQSRHGEDVFKTLIRKNTDINKALPFRKTIFQQSTQANGAVDYGNLADEVIARLNEKS